MITVNGVEVPETQNNFELQGGGYYVIEQAVLIKDSDFDVFAFPMG